MKILFQILKAKNFDQACERAERITEEFFLLGEASEHSERTVRAATLILQQRDELHYKENALESYTSSVYL